MKNLNLKLVNEINNCNLNYTISLIDISIDVSVYKGKAITKLQKLEFINKHNENVRRNPVIGTPLHIQYYLLDMKKFQECMIPF